MLEISRKKAENVIKYFIEHRVNEKMLKPKGFGALILDEKYKNQ